MKNLLIFFISILLCSCNQKQNSKEGASENKIKFDSHVHIMSPQLIAYWKSLGIPFSRADEVYSNVDTIMKLNQAENINLIGMGYVYGNPEYYEGDDGYKKMMEENNYLLEQTKKYSENITPYFATDPLKTYSVEEIVRCQKVNPKSGLKLHFNTSQVYLTEPVHLQKVKMVFEKAAEYKLPILLHFDNWHPKFGKPDIELLVDSILTQIKPIQLQIAHFGTSGGFNEKTKRFLDAYLDLRKQNRIPERHNILLDISAVALDKDSEGVSKLTDEEFSELKKYINKIGLEHIIFGTDYPLYTSDKYFEILKTRLGLNDTELNKITMN